MIIPKSHQPQQVIEPITAPRALSQDLGFVAKIMLSLLVATIGTLQAYCMPKNGSGLFGCLRMGLDCFQFYELLPAVISIAKHYSTCLVLLGLYTLGWVEILQLLLEILKVCC